MGRKKKRLTAVPGGLGETAGVGGDSPSPVVVGSEDGGTLDSLVDLGVLLREGRVEARWRAMAHGRWGCLSRASP